MYSVLVFLFGFHLYAQEISYVEANYEKNEFQIPMRDGVKLFTQVYMPKDKSRKYPFLMRRTCYSVRPYGEDRFPNSLGPNQDIMEKGYIFVYQDVRGRWMSEGEFDNMRPHIPGNDPKDGKAVDESSDTFDTIEWLLANIDNHNGKVGQWGISYPGFYTAAALPEAHPALRASSPQAPIADFFFDDFHHMGAFLQSYLYAFPVFGTKREGPTQEAWYRDAWDAFREAGSTHDGYQFNLNLGSLKFVTDSLYPNDFFWKQVVEHPDYDEFWQKRSILPHLRNIDHAVLTVGGWFDAEDLFGPLNIYKTIENNNKKAKNHIVMGPWSHGDWARERGIQKVNHIYFGDSISTFYHRNIETPFFEYYLKNEGTLDIPEAWMFDTGTKEWVRFDEWPPKNQTQYTLRFSEKGRLLLNEPGNSTLEFEYLSDPDKPVPYRSEIAPVRFTPRPFMTDDQRHASMRPDVLTFKTDVLTDPVQFAGEITAKLKVALNVTDADFVVKLIDVYPDNYETGKHDPDNVEMAGYQQLVRHEVFRGRFRNSFSEPMPFEPGKVEEVLFPLQDILHTFKPGHRIMIQIHSTWFPYIDRNPQKYVENIFEAEEDDFIKGFIKIMGDSEVVIGRNDELEKMIELRK